MTHTRRECSRAPLEDHFVNYPARLDQNSTTTVVGKLSSKMLIELVQQSVEKVGAQNLSSNEVATNGNHFGVIGPGRVAFPAVLSFLREAIGLPKSMP